MKIYFTGAISASEQFGNNYRIIVENLEAMGHTVYADHILGKEMIDLATLSPKDHEAYYKKMMSDLKKSDLLVAEVSFPSTVHVGHELTLALEFDKPVLALFIKEKRPVLFWGITSDRFYAAEYNQESLRSVLLESVEYLSDQQDTRFNFFVSPKHQNYLDYISRTRKLPRAVFLRRLIEEEMENDDEYNSGS